MAARSAGEAPVTSTLRSGTSASAPGAPLKLSTPTGTWWDRADRIASSRESTRPALSAARADTEGRMFLLASSCWPAEDWAACSVAS